MPVPSTAYCAAFSPAGPAPMTTTSYSTVSMPGPYGCPTADAGSACSFN